MIRAAIVVALICAVPALGDSDRRPPTTIASIAKLEGVKIEYRMDDGMCSITLWLDPANVFMGANNGTFARLLLKDPSGELIGSTEIRNRFDFPEGSTLGPIDGGTLGRSLYFKFSCSKAALEHSEIHFYNIVAKGSPSQRVALRDLLQIRKTDDPT